MTVELIEGDDVVSLEISDDGSGFDLGQHGEGFGLLGMHERTDLVGGTISIDSAPGSGTTVHAGVPARHREPGPPDESGAPVEEPRIAG